MRQCCKTERVSKSVLVDDDVSISDWKFSKIQETEKTFQQTRWRCPATSERFKRLTDQVTA